MLMFKNFNLFFNVADNFVIYTKLSKTLLKPTVTVTTNILKLIQEEVFVSHPKVTKVRVKK